jgi:hypothetical protein
MFTSKGSKTTSNQRLQLYKRITSVIMFTQFTKIQQDTKDISEINTLAKHAPIALTLLDRLHWHHKSTQESKKVMPPQVGCSTLS